MLEQFEGSRDSWELVIAMDKLDSRKSCCIQMKMNEPMFIQICSTSIASSTSTYRAGSSTNKKSVSFLPRPRGPMVVSSVKFTVLYDV